MSRFNKQCAFRIPAEMKERIQETARQRLIDEADVVREALRIYFQNQDARALGQPVKQEVGA